jgi:hypothetical protein
MKMLGVILLLISICVAGDTLPLQQKNINNENFLYVFLRTPEGYSLPGFTIRIINAKEGSTVPLITDEASSVVINGFTVDPKQGSDYLVEVYKGRTLIKQWEVHLNPGLNKIVLPMG